MSIDTDDVIAQAGSNLRRSIRAAQLLDTLAICFLLLGGLSVIGTLFAVAGDDTIDPGLAFAWAMAAILGSLTSYALLRGLSSIITLMVDRVLVELDDED